MYCPNPQCPDYIEDGFPAEYVDTMSECPRCGTRLAGGPTPRTLDEGAEPGRADDPPAEVATFGSRQEAEVAASYLIAEGIETTILADDAGGEFAGVDRAEGARLLVPTSRVAEALALLEATGEEDEG